MMVGIGVYPQRMKIYPYCNDNLDNLDNLDNVDSLDNVIKIIKNSKNHPPWGLIILLDNLRVTP